LKREKDILKTVCSSEMLAIAILQGLLWDLLSGVVVMVLDFLIIYQANFYMEKVYQVQHLNS